MIELTVPWLPGGIRAVTLWPLVLYLRGYEDDPCVRLHEEYHWRQALRWGVVPWYAAYLLVGIFYIGKPAPRHPMEREAYRIERECRRQRNAQE